MYEQSLKALKAAPDLAAEAPWGPRWSTRHTCANSKLPDARWTDLTRMANGRRHAPLCARARGPGSTGALRGAPGRLLQPCPAVPTAALPSKPGDSIAGYPPRTPRVPLLSPHLSPVRRCLLRHTQPPSRPSLALLAASRTRQWARGTQQARVGRAPGGTGSGSGGSGRSSSNSDARGGPSQPQTLSSSSSMSAGGAFGGARGNQPRPPEKGVFPLDHFGECKQVGGAGGARGQRATHHSSTAAAALRDCRSTATHCCCCWSAGLESMG